MCSLLLPKPIFVYTNALHFQKAIEGLNRGIPARHWLWKQTLMYRHSGFNNDQWYYQVQKKKKSTWNDLCASCTESSHTKQRQLKFIPWVCSAFILNNLRWAYPVFLSHAISPVSKGSWWALELAAVFGLFSLSQEHTTSRPVPCSWESVGSRKTIYRNSNISKKQRHHAVLLIASVKRHLNDTSLELVLQGGEKPWAENKWADLCVIFAEGIISALSTASCSSSVW